MPSDPTSLARDVIQGNVHALQQISSLTQGQVEEFQRALTLGSPPSRDSVTRALRGALDGSTAVQELRSWAAFIRWGEVGQWVAGSHISVFRQEQHFPFSFDPPLIEDPAVDAIIARIDDYEGGELTDDVVQSWFDQVAT
jgi:hypothetical protein